MGEVNTVEARAQFSEIINRAAFAKERVTRIEEKIGARKPEKQFSTQQLFVRRNKVNYSCPTSQRIEKKRSF